jgi:RNA polymerase sigma-70 factor (ECF subfamily)
VDQGENRRIPAALIAAVRPRLHRYCARMTGSVIDGEDVVQDAFVRAFEALPVAGALVENPEAWLLRVAHNAAIDFLRRRKRMIMTSLQECDATTAGDDAARRVAAAASLSVFMRLPVAQRSAVILRDVLGYTAEEVGPITGTSVLAAKAALQRGRERLRVLVGQPDAAIAPRMSSEDEARLRAYAGAFNEGAFDRLRDLLAADVRLEMVNRVHRQGAADVGEYFEQYARNAHWRLVPGFVEAAPALLAFHANTPDADPAYFILIDWRRNKIHGIRDFLFARYVMEGAVVSPWA